MAFDESRNNILQTSVRAQLFQLQSMDMDELSHKWREFFHTEPPDYGAVFMRRRLAHRIQELVYGGLSEEAKERIGAINTKISRKSNCLRSGTRIVREYHNRKHEVIVRESGYEYEGVLYSSLSAVARKISGYNRNGYTFFGLENKQ